MSANDDAVARAFVLEFDSLGTARVVQGMLRSGGVESYTAVAASVAGLPSKVRLVVEPEVAHRARWLLQESEFSDRELTYLATGELDLEE